MTMNQISETERLTLALMLTMTMTFISDYTNPFHA